MSTSPCISSLIWAWAIGLVFLLPGLQIAGSTTLQNIDPSVTLQIMLEIWVTAYKFSLVMRWIYELSLVGQPSRQSSCHKKWRCYYMVWEDNRKIFLRKSQQGPISLPSPLSRIKSCTYRQATTGHNAVAMEKTNNVGLLVVWIMLWLCTFWLACPTLM